MRKSLSIFLVVIIQLVIATLLGVHCVTSLRYAEQRLAGERSLVERLMLTDLALFTEARYTRHLSQADLHTAFQDFPMALEHFPSGSFVQPAPGHYQREP
ncbi:hypothetical protein ACW73L_13775 [Methylolobus aquaticus]